MYNNHKIIFTPSQVAYRLTCGYQNRIALVQIDLEIIGTIDLENNLYIFKPVPFETSYSKENPFTFLATETMNQLEAGLYKIYGNRIENMEYMDYVAEEYAD